MNREDESIFEMLAELTGGSPGEVERTMGKSIQKLKDNNELVLISESFPFYQLSGEALERKGVLHQVFVN